MITNYLAPKPPRPNLRTPQGPRQRRRMLDCESAFIGPGATLLREHVAGCSLGIEGLNISIENTRIRRSTERHSGSDRNGTRWKRPPMREGKSNGCVRCYLGVAVARFPSCKWYDSMPHGVNVFDLKFAFTSVDRDGRGQVVRARTTVPAWNRRFEGEAPMRFARNGLGWRAFAILCTVVVGVLSLAPTASASGPVDPGPKAASTNCNAVVYAPPGGGYGPVSPGKCATAGYKGYLRPYHWVTQEGANGYMCAEAWGFPGGHLPGAWYPVGCGWEGTYGVPWGNSLAVPKMRAHDSGAILSGIFSNWS